MHTEQDQSNPIFFIFSEKPLRLTEAKVAGLKQALSHFKPQDMISAVADRKALVRSVFAELSAEEEVLPSAVTPAAVSPPRRHRMFVDPQSDESPAAAAAAPHKRTPSKGR